MGRTRITLVSGAAGVAAVALAAGGYVLGASQDSAAEERTASCADARKAFTTLTAQVRKAQHEGNEDSGIDSSRWYSFEAARTRILATSVAQNPTCFDAVTRATAAVVLDGPKDGAEGEWDVALCAPTGTKDDECLVTE
ncbi:hypothetical protein ACFWVC_09055 [Streptomyces sp. NPDC058691]|uniref:hypothetical protein n=1 Tax=Streptomyces sp. NPDC058691 TaxID=3346601 RepID=UPI00366A35E4